MQDASGSLATIKALNFNCKLKMIRGALYLVHG